MSANAANRVKNAVERVVTILEQEADTVASELHEVTEQARDKFHRVKTSVTAPLKQALAGLDELLGSNGGPPLEDLSEAKDGGEPSAAAADLPKE